eukprot:CAMPEP_0206619868 /NCGR_PEP_ID=MMETSP0325_2-20121206/61152_1 /ASSEMBLY_ACC=CAM_ASM_000347 /TAXON_ID=2866 /ORGANISM="Crypthecodinium cohnii, Strain Seligo" /LENGTH=54 /DNA_ID=CAMNT_0054142455 /DNA_START=126 /DNA_END=287 /DNA_ORIENTATION=-
MRADRLTAAAPLKGPGEAARPFFALLLLDRLLDRERERRLRRERPRRRRERERE